MTVDLPGEAHFPREYVDDMRTKIDLYRRLTRISSDVDLEQFQAELTDRFGPPPAPVLRLLSLAELQIDAAVWQIHAIHREDRFVVLSYSNRPRIEHLARLSRKRLRVVDDEQAYLTLSRQDISADEIIAAVKSVLRSK